jgi:hypothetical protein
MSVGLTSFSLYSFKTCLTLCFILDLMGNSATHQFTPWWGRLPGQLRSDTISNDKVEQICRAVHFDGHSTKNNRLQTDIALQARL